MTYMQFTDDVLIEAVKDSISVREVMRKLGYKKLTSSSQTHISKRIKRLGIDLSHMKGQSHWKGKPTGRMRKTDDILKLNEETIFRKERRSLLHRALQERGVKYKCVKCDCNSTWQGEPITLHIDHINGNWNDNRQENLRYLCPNCHSQTKTFSNKKRI